MRKVDFQLDDFLAWARSIPYFWTVVPTLIVLILARHFSKSRR